MPGVKGNGAEREIAAIFSKWWCEYENGISFVRTPSSGGWSNATVRSTFRASGDIMTTSSKFPFSVEVKRREKWAEESLIMARKSPVWGWWHQASIQALEMNLSPILCLRRNRKPWWCIFSLNYMNSMKEKYGNLVKFDNEHGLIRQYDFDEIEPRIQDGDFVPVLFELNGLLKNNPVYMLP